MRKTILLTLAFGLSLILFESASAQEKPAAHSHEAAAAAPKHVIVAPTDIQWGDTPPGIPAGSRLAVLYGDPTKAGPFVIRVKGPDGYKIPAHWHPTTESITVLSGTFYIGTGDTLDESKGMAMAAGAFSAMPAKMRHFVWFKGDTEIEIHSMGPFQITYVNPADDPRNAKK